MNCKLLLFAALPALMVAACATGPSTAEVYLENAKRQKEVQDKFEAGGKLMDEEKYEAAAKIFDGITVDIPATTLDGMVLYNSGVAYQMMGDCRKSSDRFRRLVRFAQKSSPFLSVRGKLRLSEAMTCLGENRKATILLVEVFRDRKHLPVEIGEAEIPAKLAAAYASRGDRKTADKYLQIAELGLKKLELQNRNMKDLKQVTAKTLYVMGNLSQLGGTNLPPVNYFTTLKTFQPYLLRSAMLGQDPWSGRAIEEIAKAYDGTWQLVEKAAQPAAKEQAKDSARARRDLKAQRAEIVRMAQDCLRALHKNVLPGRPLPTPVKDLLARLQTQQAKFSNYIAGETPGSELTDAALKAQAAKREGQVKAKEQSVLETQKKQ